MNALGFLDRLELSEKDMLIAAQILKEIRSRLGFLQSVGLGYLTLSRMAARARPKTSIAKRISGSER